MKANAIRLYKNALEMINNPKGADALERDNVRKNAIKNKAMWEEHFKVKYKNDAEIQALIKPEEKEENAKPRKTSR